MCRKPCKSCPWILRNNPKWERYVKKMTDLGKIEDGHHACHSITFDSWGYNNPIGEHNVCIGSLIKDNE